MENTFDINYQDQPVKVDYQAGETPNKHLFTVQLPDGPIQLQCRKDNEGAFQWLDENDKATDTTRAIRDAVETYLLEHSITL